MMDLDRRISLIKGEMGTLLADIEMAEKHAIDLWLRLYDWDYVRISLDAIIGDLRNVQRYAENLQQGMIDATVWEAEQEKTTV